MKCTTCDNEVEFNWPKNEQSRKELQRYYHGPLCRECSAGSLVGGFIRTLEAAGATHLPVAMWKKDESEIDAAVMLTD